MALPDPSAAQRKLETLLGTWRGEERLHASPSDPTGHTARAVNTNRPGLHGLVVITDYRQVRDGRTSFEGHGIYRYDAAAGVYLLHWFDTAAGGSYDLFRGSFDGPRLVMHASGPAGHLRQTHDFAQPGVMAIALDRSDDGRSWQPWLEGRYLRLDQACPEA